VPLERLVRRAARVLLVSTDGRILLLRGGDPRRPEATWWFTPGGGIEDDETTEQAARRELAEETGLHHDEFGPVVLRRVAEFEFDGMIYEQTEEFFLVRTPVFALDTSGWSPIEVATVVEHRWWTIDELRTTNDLVYPEGLAELLDRLVGESGMIIATSAGLNALARLPNGAMILEDPPTSRRPAEHPAASRRRAEPPTIRDEVVHPGWGKLLG
jgi:8-oxo-dGTP pyrophosphatase MutT (NUDIX family)